MTDHQGSPTHTRSQSPPFLCILFFGFRFSVCLVSPVLKMSVLRRQYPNLSSNLKMKAMWGLETSGSTPNVLFNNAPLLQIKMGASTYNPREPLLHRHLTCVTCTDTCSDTWTAPSYPPTCPTPGPVEQGPRPALSPILTRYQPLS